MWHIEKSPQIDTSLVDFIIGVHHDDLVLLTEQARSQRGDPGHPNFWRIYAEKYSGPLQLLEEKGTYLWDPGATDSPRAHRIWPQFGQTRQVRPFLNQFSTELH